MDRSDVARTQPPEGGEVRTLAGGLNPLRRAGKTSIYQGPVTDVHNKLNYRDRPVDAVRGKRSNARKLEICVKTHGQRAWMNPTTEEDLRQASNRVANNEGGKDLARTWIWENGYRTEGTPHTPSS